MLARETSDRSAVALTDRAYYNMMKCADAHLTDPEERKERIETLFSEACVRGLCSANVLALFRDSVSAEEYELTVGNGRLAGHWLANISSPRALYTDGSGGGEGKAARRRGKPVGRTEKQRKIHAQRVQRRKDKKAKKFFRKMSSS